MTKPSLDQSPNYKRFIEERDKALEHIFLKYRLANTLVMDQLKSMILSHVHSVVAQGKRGLPHFETLLKANFSMAAQASAELMLRQRASTFILAKVGEAEAIGRALGKVQKVDASKEAIDQAIHADTMYGGHPFDRIEYYYNKLMRKVLSSVEHALLVEESIEDALKRVEKAFPKTYTFERPKRQLRRLKEAEDPEWLKKAKEDIEDELAAKGLALEIPIEKIKQDMMQGIVDEETWEAMVQEYLSEYLPTTSYTRSAADFTIDDAGNKVYDWELENEESTDFVRGVRKPQKDAANENGIIDLMWIAVSHKTLCESCQWRDGLVSSEIEDKLKSEHEDDDVDAIVPPAHFNCYCKMAPVTQELLDATPDDSVEKEFNEWLKS